MKAAGLHTDGLKRLFACRKWPIVQAYGGVCQAP